MQTTTFDRTAVERIRIDLDAAIKAVAEKHGISGLLGRGSFTDVTLTIKAEFATLSIDSEVNSKEAEAFKQNAAYYGVDCAAIGKTFRHLGTDYTLTGMNPKATNYPYLGRRADGKTFKFANDVVRAAFPLQRL